MEIKGVVVKQIAFSRSTRMRKKEKNVTHTHFLIQNEIFCILHSSFSRGFEQHSKYIKHDRYHFVRFTRHYTHFFKKQKHFLIAEMFVV